MKNIKKKKKEKLFDCNETYKKINFKYIFEILVRDEISLAQTQMSVKKK